MCESVRLRGKRAWTGAVCGWALLALCRAEAQVPPPQIAASYFLRGDSNLNKTLEIGDPVRILNTLFLGSEALPCEKAADANDDGILDLSDPVFLLSHLFVGGPGPNSPGRDCGVDLTEDGLGCARYDLCGYEELGARGYAVRDNLTRCPGGATPCLWLTATGRRNGVPFEVDFSDLNLCYLGDSTSVLTPQQKANFAGGIVNGTLGPTGYFQSGPQGALGEGLTLVVLSTVILHARKPDMVVPSFRVSGAITETAGGVYQVPVELTVLNQALRMPNGCTASIRRGSTALGSFSVPELEEDQSVTIATTLRFPDGSPGGRIAVTGVADSEDAIEEQAEDNNVRTLMIQFPRDPRDPPDPPDPPECEIEIINGKPVRICE